MTSAGRLQALAGGLVAAVVAVWFAVVEVLWLPLHVGALPLPLSIPVAFAVNLLLVTLTHRFTGSRVAAVVPAVLWLVVVLPASQSRPEGDVLLPGDWRGLGFLLLGVLGASVAVGRVLATPPAPRPEAAVPHDTPGSAQGSGARR